MESTSSTGMKGGKKGARVDYVYSNSRQSAEMMEEFGLAENTRSSIIR